MKKLNKKLKKLEEDSEDYQEKSKEIQVKIDYIKVRKKKSQKFFQYYPRGQRYISIIKEENLNDEARKRRDEILESTKELAKKAAEVRLGQLDETKGRKVQEIEDDAFFVDEDIELDDSEKRQVDKKGNVI